MRAPGAPAWAPSLPGLREQRALADARLAAQDECAACARARRGRAVGRSPRALVHDPPACADRMRVVSTNGDEFSAPRNELPPTGAAAARVAAVRRAAPFLLILAILVFPALAASGVLAPLNDLLALGQAGGQEPAKVATARRAEPPLVATPRAHCGPGSKPEPGIQGRVPAGAATDGLHCNVDLVSPPGHLGRLQGAALRRPRRARVCLLRHGAALPGQRAQARHYLGGRRRARHERSRAPGADGDAHRAADDVAARVAQPQPARAACWPRCSATRRPTRGSSRSTTSARTAATRCCSRPGRSRASATRAASRRTARRSTRTGTAFEGDHRDRRDRPEAAARDLAGQRPLARHGAEPATATARTSRTRTASC